jgi:hypothetical protein
VHDDGDLQSSLQRPTGEMALQCGFSEIGLAPYIRSPRFRPPPLLAYEQMFPSTKSSKLAQRTLGALRLTRSFLLLEDDYDVDWEVDRDEPVGQIHPHRAPLRGRTSRQRAASRRAGQPAPQKHVCLSPVARPAHESARAARIDRRRRATRA